MTVAAIPMVMGLGTTELLIILGVLILLFGAKKLPELARGSGRALRIFKSETKGLMDDDDTHPKTPEQKQIEAQHRVEQESDRARSHTDASVQPRPDSDR